LQSAYALTLEDKHLEVSHSLEEIFKQATINEPVSRGGRDTKGQTLEVCHSLEEIFKQVQGGRDTKGRTLEVSHSLVILEDRDNFADLDLY
jgi:hypothetical protein